MNELHRLSPFLSSAFGIALILAGLGRMLPLNGPAPWWLLAVMLGSGAGLLLAARHLDYEVRVYGSGLETSSTVSLASHREGWLRARRWAAVAAVLIALTATVSTGAVEPTVASAVWLCAVAVPSARLLGVLAGVDGIRRLLTALTPWSAVAWASGAPWTGVGAWEPAQAAPFGLLCAACLLLAEAAARPLTNLFGRSVGQSVAVGLILLRVMVSLLALWAVFAAATAG